MGLIKNLEYINKLVDNIDDKKITNEQLGASIRKDQKLFNNDLKELIEQKSSIDNITKILNENNVINKNEIPNIKEVLNKGWITKNDK